MTKKTKIPQNEWDAVLALFKSYKKLILSITLVGFFLSILYVMFWYKPIYKAIVLVQIGKLNGKLIEETKILHIKLNTQYTSMHDVFPKVSRIKLYDSTMGLLRIDAIGYSSQTLDNYLQDIVRQLSHEHNSTYTKYITNTIATFNHFNTLIETQKKDIIHLKKEVKKDEDYLRQAKAIDQILINMYTLKLLRDDSALQRTEKNLTSSNGSMIVYRNRLLSTVTYNTHLYNKVKILPDLVNTQKEVIIAVGVVGGLLFSLLLAFFLSFITTKKD